MRGPLTLTSALDNVPDNAQGNVPVTDTSMFITTVQKTAQEKQPHHVRATGINFKKGDMLLDAGRRLSAVNLALAGVANHVRAAGLETTTCSGAGLRLRAGRTRQPGHRYANPRFNFGGHWCLC